MSNLKFCLEAIQLHDDDLGNLTDSIEQYTRAGMPAEQAQLAAIEDTLADVRSDRQGLVDAATAKLGPVKTSPDRETYNGAEHGQDPEVAAQGRDGAVAPAPGARDGEAPAYGTPREGSVSHEAVHYSPEPRTRLDASYYGRGLKGAEAERLQGSENDDIRPRVFFYVDKGRGVQPEAGVGANAHRVRLDNLYDVWADPLKLVQSNPGANNWERAIMRAGFDGYVNLDKALPQGYAALIGRRHNAVPVAGANVKAGLVPAPEAAKPLRAALMSRELNAIDTGNIPGATIKNGDLLVPPEQRDAANKELARIGSPVRVRAAVSRAQPGADMERLADLLGPQLYGSMKDMGPVTVKELFQNSFDALKAVIQKQPGFVGRIEIKLDEARRTITLTDNGNGMTPEIINKAFLTMAGTNKETDRSSGGFGIAKMLFLFGNDSLHLETVRDGHKSILATSGAQLKRSFRDPEEAPEIHTEKTREPSGTTVSVRVPEKWRNPSTGEDEEITFPREYSVSDMLRHSPLFEDIEVLVNGSPMPIGANFDKDGYTVFSTVKFDWGTARILISRGEQKTGSYGKNLHVLSNGLWQFSGAVKEDPMDMYSENIPRVIYINVEPRVKPEEPGYPFALNRQGFSPAVRDDFDKITKYLTVLYGGSKAAENAKGFGTIEYVDPTGQVTRSMDLTPKFDEAARKNMLRINEGDRIEVTNGRMIVNGREVPELTKKDLQAAKVDASKYKIPEDQVDPSRPMIHDNMDIEVSQTDELRRELDAKFERIKGERDAARQEMDRLAKERSIAERLGLGHNDAFEKARDRFWELAEALDEVYDEMGTLADGEKQKLPITTYMRRLHGRRFDQYLYSLGNTFMQLRDAIIAEGGTTYRGMTKVPVGVSFDEKYYGVHIQVPFRGMFLNPAITQMDAMDGAHNPRKVGASMLHTMIHEIAHFAEMNHSTEFISEMQRLHSILETSDTFDLGKLVARLTRTLETYSDVYADLNKAVRSDAVSNRGVKLEESAYDGRHDDDAGDVSRQRAQRRDDRHLAGEAAAGAGDGAAREDAQGVRRDAQGQRRVTPSKDRSANEEAQEIAKPVLPFLTKDERAKLRRDTAQKLVDLFKQLPSGDEMAAIAWAGKAKRGWYRQSAEALVHIYGADAPRFAAVLAAMSPQTGVEDNLINTVKTWKNWVKAGRPTDRASIFRIMGQSVQGNNLTDSVLPAWVNNTVRALSTPNPEQLVISGPKVNSFMLNLRGEVTEVTNDAWMATFAAIDQRLFAGRLNEAGTDPGKGPGYLAMSARVRQAAKRLSQLTGDLWTPAEVQETVWSWTKTLYELQTVEAGALDILYNEEITDELIAATPDFRSLLLEDRYAQQIRETGLGRELDSLGSRRDDAAAGDAAEPRAASQKAPFAPDAQGRYEKRVAERLERLRAERRAAGAEEVHLSVARDGAGDGSRRGSGGSLAPLAGAPSVAGATGPDPRLVEVAHQYAREHGIALRRQAAYVKVDVERAARIAAAYEAMPHAPSDPKVKAAYADLIRQTREQYDALVAAGYEFTFFDAKTDPYDGNPWNAMRDLRANQRMAVYGTYDGFGTEGITAGAVEDNPLLADTGLTWPDQDGVEHAVTGNDLFRAVHDAFGHGLEGAGFRADGEENAWQAHVRLFTGAAVGALTSETRGQNSWLNFGPFGEKNRTAKVEDTVFAQQKTGLMPEWTWSEGRVEDQVREGGFGPADRRSQVDDALDRFQTKLATSGKTHDPLVLPFRGGWAVVVDGHVVAQEQREDQARDTMRSIDADFWRGEIANGNVPKWEPPVRASKPRDDLFPETFASKRSKVPTQRLVSSNGETEKGGNVDSEGRQIAVSRQALENFWRWFGHSEAVDAKGRPRVYYHTTRNGDFAQFEVGRTTKNSTTFGDYETQRHAIFFAEEHELSEVYGQNDGRFVEGAAVIPSYLKIENPLDVSGGYFPQGTLDRFEEEGINPRWMSPFDWSHFDDEDGQRFVEAAKRLGYDSVIFWDESPQNGESFKSIAVFEPGQIKSAIGNRGTFDPASPKITASKPRDTQAEINQQLYEEDAVMFFRAKLAEANQALEEFGYLGVEAYNGRPAAILDEDGNSVTPRSIKDPKARAAAQTFLRIDRASVQAEAGNPPDFTKLNFARARTAPPAAATPQPAAPGRSAWRDATGRLQFAPGQVLYDLLGKAANPLLTRLQLKAASPELRRALREMKVQVAKAQETAARVASQVNTLPDPEREMVSDIIEQQLATGVVPPARAVQVADMMNQIMGQQSAELVRLGMLSQEAANRWNGKYLPRFYQSKLTRSAADLWADAYRKVLGRPRVMKGIGGKHLHSRGLYETIDESELLAYLALGWEVRDPDYDPVNGSPDGTVQIWRDFTPAERQNMGEIRDSGFRFVMGYMQTQKDIALGRLFETLANDATISSRTPTAKLTVQVPKSIIEGTGAKTYGKLAGRYVSPETLSHLSSIEEAQSEMLQLYRKGLSAWKEGKTALNPVSHVNNVLSNLTMAHFAGVSYWDGHKYAMAAVDLAATAPMVREANDAGLFLGTLSDEELMNVLPPALRALARKQEGLGAKTGRIAFDIVSFYLRRPMGWAYKAEDSFFRYLVYRDARKHGASPADAVDYAQRYIFAYDDLPKGARRIRDFGIPFFSYTYKAMPALLHTALTHPLRFAAPAAVLWGANAAAFALAYGDDEDEWDEKLRKYVTDPAHRARVREQEELERKHLPPWLKGASALVTPKAIRLGMDALTGLPLYLDASRIIPGGDLFDVSPNAGGLPLPQPLTPSHPLFTTAVAMLANKDMYFGREITDSNDTTGEKAAKRGAWIWRQFSPAIAAGNYHWERGMQALAQATGHPVEWMPDALGGDATGIGRDGLPVQPKFAAMQTFGVKVRPIDLETAERIEQATREKMIREIDIEMRRLNRLVSKGAISERAFDEASELAQEKKDRLRAGLTVDGRKPK